MSDRLSLFGEPSVLRQAHRLPLFTGDRCRSHRCLRLISSKPAWAVSVALCLAPAIAEAQDDDDLAKQLSNPVASLISVPFQSNWDRDIGPRRDGRRYTLNLQPVIPFSLNSEWNLISRTILPYIDQDLGSSGGSRRGQGDVVQSLFFSPKEATAGGLIWGAGPVLLLPTGRSGLSADQWGLGPTGVVLKQDGPWTYGALANHLWSVGGSGDRDISATFLQPFASYTTKAATSFSVNTESTYDWEGEQWTVPINFVVAQVIKLGTQPVQVGGGLRYFVDSPSGGPHGWAFRLNLTLLFPK